MTTNPPTPPVAPASFGRNFAVIASATTACFLLASCSVSGASNGPADQALVVGSDLTYPPYAYFDGSTPAGFDPDITKALADKLHMKVDYKDTRFEQLIPGLKSQNFDVIASALYITAERAKEVDYIPYFSTGSSILAKASGEKLADVGDLCGKKVAVIKGGVPSKNLEVESGKCVAAGHEAIDARAFTTDPEATQALVSGQVDAQISDAAVAARVSESTQGAVKITSTKLLYPIPVGLAVVKGNTALKGKLEQGLKDLKGDGTYEKLLSKYNLQAPDESQISEILGK